jgi:hypothetical protein
MTKRQTAMALRLLAAEVESGECLPLRLTNLLTHLERDATVQALLAEDLDDRRAVAQARKDFAAGRSIPHEQLKRELGL